MANGFSVSELISAMAIEPLFCEQSAAISALLARCCPLRRVSTRCVSRLLFSHGIFAFHRVWGICDAKTKRWLGVIAALSSGQQGHIQLLAVEPTCRSQGLGERLLHKAETQLAAQGARRVAVDGSAPLYFRPGLDFDDDSSRRFFERHGYRPSETRRSLHVELEGRTLEASARHGMVVRRQAMQAPQTEQALAAIAEVFSPAWATEARLAALDEPSALHVAWLGTQPVGFAASGLCGPDVFGPMGVLPPFRGRGFSQPLLFAALRDIRARGCDSALISWLGPEAYYSRLLPGCRPVDYLVLHREIDAQRCPVVSHCTP
jgi:mycothiol synthase